jgi:terminase small subunit-like protein
MAGRAVNKGGRPDKYSPEVVKKIVESLELGLPMKWACRANGVHPETFANWQVKHPELAEVAVQAKARFIQAHLHNIKNIAKDGNWQASMTLLERCVPEDFARPEAKIQIANQQINIRDAAPNPFLSSEAELAFIRQIVDEQPNELDDAPKDPLALVGEMDEEHKRQLERDRQQVEEWRHGYEKPRLMPPADPPAEPTEPVNEKLSRIRIPSQAELAQMRESEALAKKVAGR